MDLILIEIPHGILYKNPFVTPQDTENSNCFKKVQQINSPELLAY